MTELTVSARFDRLGDLLRDIAIRAGLRFRVVQIDGTLVFQVLPIVNRAETVRLDIANRHLVSQSVVTSAPQATRVIVAGQGEGELRTLLERSTTDSQTAEADWGRRIEEWKDQRQTDDTAELAAAGDQVLAEGGFTGTSVAAVPADDTMRLAVDWNVGDIITAVIEGQETTATVTEATIAVDSRGTRVTMALGDPLGFDTARALGSRLGSAESRLANLERNGSTFNGSYASLTGKPTLGGAAALDVGTTAGTVAAGDHGHTAAAVGAVAGTVRLTVAPSAPSSPVTNDVWIDTTATPVVKVWSGSAWV